VLAVRFGVSWEYVRKVRRQHRLHGQRTRVVQSRFGPRSRVTDTVAAHMLVTLSRGQVMRFQSQSRHIGTNRFLDERNDNYAAVDSGESHLNCWHAGKVRK